MLQVRLPFFFAALSLALSSAVLAQAHAGLEYANAINEGYGVQNAPYSAQRRVTTNTRGTDGKIIHRSEASESEARDSQGRTYTAGERQWTVLEDGKNVVKT